MKALKSCLGVGVSALTLLAGLGAPACGPQPLQSEEVDVVATRLGEGADFGELVTFSLPTDVIDLCDELTDIPPGGIGGAGGLGGGSSLDDYDTCVAPDHSLDGVILDTVARELEALGYQQVDSDADPDIAVLIGLVAQGELRVWEGVPWCYAHALFPGCWEPTYAYPYRLPFGTLLMDFGLPEASGDELASAWTAVLAGVGRPDADEDRLTTAIETAFAQSPYLADGGAP